MLDISLDNKIVNTAILDEAIQELDILFNTECTELLGDTNYGLSIDQFLWSLTPTTEAFKEYINKKLSGLYYIKYFNYDFDLKFIEDEFQNMYHLTINLYINNDRKIQKEYDFK